MPREITALILLALLLIGAVWNIRSVDRLTAEICACIDSSEEAVRSGDGQAARAAMEKGLQLWLNADSYTHIFIRHTEIDGATDAFYSAMEELSDNDSEALGAAYDKLRYHLISISSMEHVSLGSIF